MIHLTAHHVASLHHGTLNRVVLGKLIILANLMVSYFSRWFIVTYIMPVQQLVSHGDP